MNNYVRRFLTCLTCALFVACSRAQEEKTSVSLQLTLPGGNGTFSASETGVRHLAVSVSGPGQDYFFEWDAHKNATTAPTSLSITLEPGQHLIQVAAYVATASGGGFYYGDQNLNLNGGNKSVAISTSAIGSSSGMNARVYGRYLSTPLYTGTVTGYFFPPGGKPAMPILSTEIYAGWFDFFAIDGVTFKYVHDVSGNVLFNSIDVVAGANPEILINGASVKGVSGNRLMQVYVPPYYRGMGATADTSEAMTPGISLMGYFGTVPALKEACIQSGPSGTYNSGSTLFQYATPANYLDYDFTSFSSIAVSKVGTSGFDDCTSASGTPYDDYVPWDALSLANRGFQSSAAVVGPLKRMGTNSAMIDTTPSGANLDAYIYTLPEVFATSTPGGLEGIDVFVRNDSNTVDFETDSDETGPDCADATANGFVLADTLDASTCPADVCTYNDPVRDSTKDYHLIFCPFREDDGDYYYTSHKFKTTAYRDFTAVTFASTVTTPTQAIVLPNTPALNCRLVSVTPSAAPNFSTILSLTKAGTATYGIYSASDTTCAGSEINSLSFASGSSAPQQYRVKSTTLGTINISYSQTTDPSMASMSVTLPPNSMSSGYLFCVQNPPVGACTTAGNISLTLASGGAAVSNEAGRTLNFAFSGANLTTSVCSSFNLNTIGPSLTLIQFKAGVGSGAESLISSDPDVGVSGACGTVAW